MPPCFPPVAAPLSAPPSRRLLLSRLPCLHVGGSTPGALGPAAAMPASLAHLLADPSSAPPPSPAASQQTAYHYMYTRYLAHARFHQLNILEVGLGCDMRYGAGASLRLWRAYLPCSRISFVEYNE